MAKLLLRPASRSACGHCATAATSRQGERRARRAATLPLSWAAELKPHGVAIMSVTPGFLRSESMLQHFGVTEANWRDGGKSDTNFLESESPLYVGRAVAALAADPDVLERTGMLYSSWELARQYKFTDYDGRRPDWGRHTIDWSASVARQSVSYVSSTAFDALSRPVQVVSAHEDRSDRRSAELSHQALLLVLVRPGDVERMEG